MKKLIALFTVLSFTLAAIGQNDTTRYTMVNGYGFTYNRLKAKAALVMPADTVQNKLPGSLVVLNDSLYVRTGVKWEKIGANAAVDTVIMSTRAWRQKGDDSVSALVALRVRISDTASMLLPYLRKSDTSAMLFPYFRKGDTVTLSNRINTKLNISDTAAMLAPYAKAVAGLPIGGTTGQILAKNSATNYDVAWIDNYTTDVRETVKATESINKGQAVYVTGADGTNVLVSKASNTSDATSSKTLGLLFQNLATNDQGFVIIQGRLSGLNTIGATAGDPVWLGTNGNLLYGTANKPVAPAHMVYIGVVTRVNSNNGEIFVNVQNGFELEELHDVLITDSVNNQVIAYDSTTRLWKNKTIAQALGYTPANNATTVKYSDTASMLSPYLRDADTATLSNRINLKVNISDTASMLSPYARTSNVNAALALKVNISDTSSMLTPYLRKADTTAMLSPYARTSNVNAALATKLNISDTASMLSPYLKESDTLFLSNRINLKLNISDTAAMIAPYLRKSDTTAMLTPYLRKADTLGLSNRINLKVNISDTSSMLSPYIRAAGYGLTKSGQSFLVDTAAMATRARVQKGIDSVVSIIPAAGVGGSGTTNYVPKFTASTTLGNSQIFDNGTNVGIGTASPISGYKLHVVGDIRVANDGTENNAVQITANSSIGTIQTRYARSLVFGTDATERLHIFANGRIGVNTTTDAGYQFDINGTLRTVNGANFATTSGNVGIGTASPAQKLDVAGITRVTGGTIYAQASGTESSGYQLNAITLGYDATNAVGWITAGGAAARTNLSLQQSGGEVLIGTALTDAGDYKLQVAGNIYNTGSAVFAATSGETYIGTTSDAGDYKLQVVGNARVGTGKLDIASNTTFGLGVARSGTSEVAGQIYNSNGILYLGAESSAGGQIFTGSSAYAAVIGSGANYPLQFATNNATRATINTNGELLINTTTDAGDYKIQSNGNVAVTGKIDVTSSESIGHNIVRSGTSDIAAQIYSSNAWLLYGAESSTGGSILTGSTQYAAVVGSGYNRPLQFGTNSTVRMEIDSTGLVGINTTAPTERLDVNGKARIRTVDSTATAMNMLYVDATGVIKKTSVPGTTVAVYNDVASIATGSGFTFAKQYTNNAVINNVVRVEDVNSTIATVTLQIAAYKTTSTFTTGTWQSFATIPAAYAPTTTVYVPIIDFADASVFTSTGGTQFSNVIEYSGKKVMRIDPSGNVDVRIGTVDNSATLSGTNYVLIPVTATWVINNTVF